MKIKFKTLAAAAVLAAVSATASATINVSTTPDLLFIAWENSADGTTTNSYVRDLGVSLSALTTNQTFSAPAASIFTSQFPTTTGLQWGVYALDNTSPAVYLTGSLSKLAGLADTDVQAIAGGLTASLGGITQLEVAANGYIKPNGEYTGSSTASDQTNGVTLNQTFDFGLPVAGKGVGASQNFLEVAPDGSASQLFTNSALSAFNGNAKGGYFTLADAAGDLTWTVSASVAAVPLPAAALLFAPGLLAMFGLGRRNKKIA